MSDQAVRPTFATALACKDPEKAIEWLQRAFGFEPTMLITDDSGKLVHSELSFGNGYIMVGDEWASNVRAPSSIDGANTQRLSVILDSDVDGHCERARAAGARITLEPSDQPYGARTYLAVDPDGHEWDIEILRPQDDGEMSAAGYGVQHFREEPSPGSLFPTAYYRDPRAAADWLARAFGFEMTTLIEGGGHLRAHLTFQGGLIAVTNELRWEGHPPRLSPLSTGELNTQTIHIQLQSDIDAHCERARAAGARIVQEPETQFYGDRTYRALDLEGHMWTLAQTVRVMTPEEWDAASGLKTQMGA